MSGTDTRPLRPRHTLSPRARRSAATAGPPPPMTASFAIAEAEVDLTALSGDIVAYVAKAAVEAIPAGPVHLAAGPSATVIRDADQLSLAGLRRRLNQPGTDPAEVGATITLAESSLLSEIVPPEPGQLGTLVLGAARERPAVMRTSGGDPAIAIRSFARLTFSYDQRSLPRSDIIRFLTAVQHRLETPWTSAG
jgi:pyruvate/2-oxoglutarate dehydrogenase complex dihydrolipoamide acyltransferase (E2) component